MSETSISPELQSFNALVNEVQCLLFAARDTDLQQQAIAKLEVFGTQLAEWKKQAISNKNENFANALLGCKFVLQFLDAELRMWLQLKGDEPEAAWDSLISAQNAILNALR